MNEYVKRKWQEDRTDPGTGLGLDALIAEAERIVAEYGEREEWCLVKARLFKMIMTRMAIGVSKEDFFPAFAVWSRRRRVLSKILATRTDARLRAACSDELKLAAGAPGHIFRVDFDHAVPDWDAAIRLGFPGLRARLDGAAVRNGFHQAMTIAADAILATLERLERHARTCADREAPRVRALADALANLRVAPPKTAYEVLLFQLLFFVFGEHVDHLQVRSLGNIDRLVGPYYAADLAAGRLTREDFKELLTHFWWQWGSIDNWWGQPVYLGGTRADGSTECNDVSRLVLEVADEVNVPTPKLQLKIAANTPRDVFERALDMARRHRSVVFCGEAPMARAMAAMGFTAEEARTCDIWGCYEFQPRARANTTLPGLVNFVKIVETLLDRARRGTFAPATFEEFKAACLEEVTRLCDRMLAVIRAYERQLDEIIPALVHSLSIERCASLGRNAVGDGMEHNLTVILQTGVGTAADALAAVREIVYERKELSLRELGETMAANWKGRESLRLRMRASRRKWGNDDPLTEGLVRELLATFGGRINGRPNSRHGRFYASGHSIDFFYLLGRHSGATPDGRDAKEEYSKNLSPAPGADREGATAVVNSFAKIGVENIPGDIILDLMLHPSTVQGDRGLMAMRALVEQYFDNGGCAVHFNVFGEEELLDAQRHPERYENLQVRVCGWNVRWNCLGRREQDAYIRRARAVMR